MVLLAKWQASNAGTRSCSHLRSWRSEAVTHCSCVGAPRPWLGAPRPLDAISWSLGSCTHFVAYCSAQDSNRAGFLTAVDVQGCAIKLDAQLAPPNMYQPSRKKAPCVFPRTVNHLHR